MLTPGATSPTASKERLDSECYRGNLLVLCFGAMSSNLDVIGLFQRPNLLWK
jgi:hypothetical protein